MQEKENQALSIILNNCILEIVGIASLCLGVMFILFEGFIIRGGVLIRKLLKMFDMLVLVRNPILYMFAYLS